MLGAFTLFEPRKIDFGFLTLQTVLDEILCYHGGNEFRITHIGKERLLRHGELPTHIGASAEAIEVAQFVLNPHGMQQDAEDDNGDGPEDLQMIQELVQG